MISKDNDKTKKMIILLVELNTKLRKLQLHNSQLWNSYSPIFNCFYDHWKRISYRWNTCQRKDLE